MKPTWKQMHAYCNESKWKHMKAEWKQMKVTWNHMKAEWKHNDIIMNAHENRIEATSNMKA